MIQPRLLIATAAVLALLGLCVAFALAQADDGNMLANAGFDRPSAQERPRDWQYTDFKTGGVSVYTATAGRNGTPAVGIRSDSDQQRGAWQQRVGLRGLGYARVSGWYRTEGLAARNGAGACVRMTYLRSATAYDFVSDQRLFLPPSETWAPFVGLFPTPDGAVDVNVELINFFVPGTVWWDDVEMRAATETEVTALMSDKFDRPAADDQVSYRPEDGAILSITPAAFVWVPVEGAQSYVLQYSPDRDFKTTDTVTVRDIAISVYTPTEPMKAGQWYWRYGVERGGQAVYSKVRGFTIPADAQEFARPTTESVLAKVATSRPRLYVNADQVAEIRAEAHGKWKAVVEPVVRSAEKELGKELFPEPVFLPTEPQERSKAYLISFQTMRPFTSGMETCALAYLCTGDRRFADEAKRRLLHFSTWDVDGPSSVSANDEAAMDIAMRGPRTFDWIYDALSDEERAKCQDFLVRRLAQINKHHLRRPFESRPYESHAGRMVGFMVEGSLAFAHEAPEAKEWMDYYLRLLWSVYPVWGSDDGGWHEGLSYWTAYLSMMTNVISELDRIGVDWKNRPFLKNTGYFGLYCAYPGRKAMSFGDGQEGSIGSSQGALMYALSSLYDNPYFRWHAQQTRAEKPGGALAFHLLKPELKALPPQDLPQARVFPHVGWVAMHSNMADPANNVLLLLHSSPYGAVSHNHANQNAFVLEAFGEPLAISSGYYQRYGSPHHAGWTWQTKSHNSILVNNEGQVPRSYTSRGYIREFDNTDGFCYTTGDAAEAYGGRLKKFLRHVLFCRPDYFVILDELEAAEPATFQWLLHSRSPMALAEAAQQVTCVQGASRLRVQLFGPEAMSFTQTDQFDVTPEKPESPNQYHFTASTRTPVGSCQILSVLQPYREGAEGALPDVTQLAAEGGVAVRVGQDVILWKDKGAGQVRAGGVTSTYDLVVVRRDAEGKPLATYSRGQGSVAAG
jgi:hypothetical protein